MRIVHKCGYDRTICEKYPVKIDKRGHIKKEEIECTLKDCEHCHFIGAPWVRTEIINE